MIRLKNVNKYYFKNSRREIHVLNNINLELPEKGIVVFHGPSGSGKTTMLNVIGGLDAAYGSIHFGDEVFNRYNPRKIDSLRAKMIGYVFQNYYILSDKTVYENLCIALDLYKVRDRNERDKRIDFALEAVGLIKYKRRVASSLSGGEQQRLSIARALVKDAKILIADEPTGNLDSRNTSEVMQILTSLSKKFLIILVTHSQSIAKNYGDRIIRFSDGQIKEDMINSAHSNELNYDDNIIYLDELKKASTKVNDVNVTIYTDESLGKYDLEIFERDGSLYMRVEGHQPKLIANNSLVQIKEARPKRVVAPDRTSEVHYANPHVPWRKRLIDGVKGLFTVRKKTTSKKSFIPFVFILLGFMLSLSFVMNNFLWQYDEKNALNGIPGYSVSISLGTGGQEHITPTYVEFYTLKRLYDLDLINDLPTDYSIHAEFTPYYPIPSKRTRLFLERQSIVGRFNLIRGRTIEDRGEVVIDKNVVDAFIKQYRGITELSYDDFINQNIMVSSMQYKIVGIVNQKSEQLFMDDYDFYLYMSLLRIEGSQLHVNILRGIIDIGYFDNDDLPEFEYNRTMVDGEAVRVDVIPGKINAYISSSYLEDVPPSINVLGTFKAEGNKPTILLNDKSDLKILLNDMYGIHRHWFYLPHYLLAGEQYFVNSDELSGVIVHECNNALIGSANGYFTNIENAFAVYVDDFELETLSSDFNFSLEGGASFYLNSSNPDGLIKYMRELGFSAEYAHKIVRDEHFASHQMMFSLLYSLSVIIYGAFAIFTFFVMRTRIIKDVYTIGVYRALGARKGVLYRKNILSSLVFATSTALVGFLFGGLGVMVFGSMLGITLFTATDFMLGISSIYVVVVFLSLLPLAMLLRRTPTQILVKYDI